MPNLRDITVEAEVETPRPYKETHAVVAKYYYPKRSERIAFGLQHRTKNSKKNHAVSGDVSN